MLWLLGLVLLIAAVTYAVSRASRPERERRREEFWKGVKTHLVSIWLVFLAVMGQFFALPTEYAAVMPWSAQVADVGVPDAQQLDAALSRAGIPQLASTMAAAATAVSIPVTPTPDVPRLNAGTFWFDKPESDVNGQPNRMGNVSDQSYTIVGAYGCWPLPYSGYPIRVSVEGEPDQWWVARSAIDLSEEEFKSQVNSAQQYQQGADCK